MKTQKITLRTLLDFASSRKKMIPTAIKAKLGKKIHDEDRVMINIGSGVWYKPHWKSLDFYSEWYGAKRWLKLSLDYVYDLTSLEPFPLEDATVDLYYSEFAFEHIPDHCSQYVFKEIYRTLKCGGGFRIIVPDIDVFIEKYKNNDVEFFKNDMNVMKHQQNRVGTITEGFFRNFATLLPDDVVNEDQVRENLRTMKKEQFLDYYTKSRQQDKRYAGHHITWYDFTKLSKMLKAAGFEKLYKLDPETSKNENFIGTGLNTRPWYPSLVVEAYKDGKNTNEAKRERRS